MESATAYVIVVLFAAAAASNDRRYGRERSVVLYPTHTPGGLACYQDRRTDGGAFWSYASDKQRRPYIFHCPSSVSAWCVKVSTGQLSVRGCSGPAGVNRAGCFHVTDPKRKTGSHVCLCNKNYCNTATTTRPSTSVRAIIMVLLLSVIIDRL